MQRSTAAARWRCLAGLHHERATDPRIGDLLALVEGSSLVTDPESGAAVNIRELRRSYDRRVRLPKTLVEELARTTSLAQGEWVTARSANDFGRFRPWLEKIFQLKRAESACLQGGLELTPTGNAPGWKPPAAAATSATDPAAAGQVVPVSVYDPLIDEYEPGARMPSWPFYSRSCAASLSPWFRPSPQASAIGRHGTPPVPAQPYPRALLARRFSNGSILASGRRFLAKGWPRRSGLTSLADGWT